jgi:hypothetical protein
MVIEREDPPWKAEPLGEGPHLLFAPAGEDRALAEGNCPLGGEHTGVSRGSINHPLLGFLRHRFGSV